MLLLMVFGSVLLTALWWSWFEGWHGVLFVVVFVCHGLKVGMVLLIALWWSLAACS